MPENVLIFLNAFIYILHKKYFGQDIDGISHDWIKPGIIMVGLRSDISVIEKRHPFHSCSCHNEGDEMLKVKPVAVKSKPKGMQHCTNISPFDIFF